MRRVLERVRAEREPQLVTLVGVPGIGKSRLVHELGLGIDGLEWLHGRCLPYGDGVTFWSLAEIVRSRLGLREGDPPAAVEAKLGDVVTDEWVNGHLRPLLGLEVESSGGDRSEEAHAAWRSFLETCAGEMPLAVVFEDLQWADDVLLDFIDHLVDWASGVALLVVCTTRPELLERRPGWGGGKTNATTISLPSLSDEETGRLVASLVGRPLMVADVQSALIARAGGNPLYAEQFALLVDDQEAGSELPETVQGLIAARIDLLAPEQKAHLQDASVLGRTFWLDALAATSGVDRRTVEVGLHALERKSFVRRERTTSLAGQVEYTFQHVLVADVAYGQIPRAARSEKHQLAAEWIASAASAEDTAELRAHHWGEALSLARAARLDTCSWSSTMVIGRPRSTVSVWVPWHEAARAIADGRLTEAADRLEAIGDVTFAAETRLVALRQLAAEGRRADVAELLPKVLGFYRSVGATRYVREAEVLLQSVA